MYTRQRSAAGKAAAHHRVRRVLCILLTTTASSLPTTYSVFVCKGVAKFTLSVQLANNERDEVYSETYTDPRDLLHDLRNGWYLGYGINEPAYHNAARNTQFEKS